MILKSTLDAVGLKSTKKNLINGENFKTLANEKLRYSNLGTESIWGTINHDVQNLGKFLERKYINGC